MGRIICLADCFDAMTSNRTYRKAMPLEVALAEIRRCCRHAVRSGLTEAFLRIGSRSSCANAAASEMRSQAMWTSSGCQRLTQAISRSADEKAA